jgi:hypothetical protein
MYRNQRKYIQSEIIITSISKVGLFISIDTKPLEYSTNFYLYPLPSLFVPGEELVFPFRFATFINKALRSHTAGTVLI